MTLCRATAIALAVSCTPIAHADPAAAEAWLLRMGEAVQGVTYRGTFVYQRDGKLETLAIVHRGTPGAERERVTTLSGTPREVLRTGDVVKCVLPDNRSVIVEKDPARRSSPLTLPTDVAGLAAHYTLELLAADTVAGRRCRLLNIAPRDAYRYGFRLCLDEETALPLKSELVAEDGRQVIEQMLFTELSFPESIADVELAPTTQVEGYAWHVRDAGPATRAAEPVGVWEATRLPAGFRMVSEQLKKAVKTDAPVHHLIYSDGLASVSVFVERFDPARPGLAGPVRRGAMQVYGRVVGDHQVTVLGEVPAATVEQIALGVAPRPLRGQP